MLDTTLISATPSTPVEASYFRKILTTKNAKESERRISLCSLRSLWFHLIVHLLFAARSEESLEIVPRRGFASIGPNQPIAANFIVAVGRAASFLRSIAIKFPEENIRRAELQRNIDGVAPHTH